MRISDLKMFSVAMGDLNYLLSLTLQGNFIDDDMIKWLVSGLISNHTLRYLDLSNNKITEKGIIKISSFLMRSKCILSLDLTNNCIGGDGGFALSLVIKENTRLKILKLGMNRIDDISGAKIFKSLAKNEFLEELDLTSNLLAQNVFLFYLQFQTTNSLVYALKNNKFIKVIDLSNTNVVFDQDLKYAVEVNPTLIKLDLRNTKCYSGILLIIQMISK